MVGEVGNEVEDMRKELKSTTAGKGSAPKGSTLPPPDTFGLDSPPPEEGDDFGAFEQQKQLEMMHEQDEALDDVFKTVGNLRQQGIDMGRELEEQREELEDVDDLADRVGGKLQHGLERVGWVIKKNEGLSRQYPILVDFLEPMADWHAETWSSCCIGVLILVLVLLLVLVLIL